MGKGNQTGRSSCDYGSNQTGVAGRPGRKSCTDGAPGDRYGFSCLCRGAQGREPFLAGFRDFCENARIHEIRDDDHQVDVAGHTAVVTFRYEMVCVRSVERFRSARAGNLVDCRLADDGRHTGEHLAARRLPCDPIRTDRFHIFTRRARSFPEKLRTCGENFRPFAHATQERIDP
jgi:hypothetical protein